MKFYKEAPPDILSKYEIEFFHQTVGKPPAAVGAHIHSAIEILYVTNGKMRIEIDGNVSYAKSGDLVLIRSNSVHSICCVDEAQSGYYVLKLTTQFLFNLFKGYDNTDCIIAFLRNKKGNRIVFEASEISNKIKDILDEMIKEYNQDDKIMLTVEKSYIATLIIFLFREFLSSQDAYRDVHISGDSIALIHKSMEYINLNYASDLTAEECAKRVNLSYSHYAKLFSAISGKSFKKYLTSLRLAKAYNALISTDLPIVEISICYGYNSPAYFTAEFKRYYGSTPSEIRKDLLYNV